VGAFGRSIGRGIKSLGSVAGGLKKAIKGKLQGLAQNPRKYRLFAKTKEARKLVNDPPLLGQRKNITGQDGKSFGTKLKRKPKSRVRENRTYGYVRSSGRQRPLFTQ
jgi:hypothetical protein